MRLFLGAFPFLALLAGKGLDLALGILPGLFWRLGAGALALFLTLPGIVRMDPCLLSYYSPLVGGLKGAERLGMETTYWGDALTPEFLEALPPGTRAFSTAPMGNDYAAFLASTGWLPPGCRPARRAEVLLVSARRSMLSPTASERLQEGPGPALEREGVVLARISLAPPSRDP